MIDLPAPVAVVCHDAGAANLILPWLSAGGTEPLLPAMAGPAAALWTARFGTRATLSVEEAIEQAAAVLTGTGWATDVEHRARKLARERRVHSVAVIDHWVNYRERFVRAGEEVLPDEIWVTDEYALDLARREFTGVPITLKPNLYLEEQVATAPPLQTNDQDVLFVAEPVRGEWASAIPGEFQSLDYFVTRRDLLGIRPDATLRLRPHPSDPLGKYDEWVLRHPGVRLDASPNLAEALGGVRWVVGCESYALVVALHAGRQAVSALPPWAPACRLPHREIVRLAGL
jgi:hypothetical protein